MTGWRRAPELGDGAIELESCRHSGDHHHHHHLVHGTHRDTGRVEPGEAVTVLCSFHPFYRVNASEGRPC